MNIIIEPVIQNKILGISYDTIFTTVITLTIFILGYILNRFYEWRKRIRHLKNIRELIVAHLKSLIEPIEGQMRSFKEMADYLGSKTIKQYTFHESSIQTDFLSGLPCLDIFQAFTLGSKKNKTRRIDAFNSMFQAIEFIKRQNSITRNQFIELSPNRRELTENFNSAIDAIMRFQDQLLGFARRNKITSSKDMFLKELNAIVYQYSQLKDQKELDTLYKCFVDPVLTLVKKYPNDQPSDILSPLVLRSFKYHNDIISLLDAHSKHYQEHSIKLEKRKEIILNTMTTIENIS
ncbi:MAG: hypothetical protein ABR936_14685 [Bacteroidota bacterium]